MTATATRAASITTTRSATPSPTARPLTPNAAASTTWTYDLQGRVLSQTDNITGTLSAYTTSWIYDALNRVRTMTYPDGEQVTTAYNAQMLPQTLGVYVTGTTYNAAGQLTQLNLGNIVSTTYTYHPQNLRLTSLVTSGGLQNLAYQYDNVGNITRITDTLRNETLNFAYDALDRLANVSGAYSQNWVYNPIGNITQFNGVNYAYSDAAHKHAVTQVGSTPYTYDANGNMLTRGSDTFTYDAENRLTQATVGGVVTQYAYNADGMRVRKTVGSATTYYIGNWYEVTQAGAVTKYYYFGGKRVALRTSAGVTYLHGDHLGSTSVTSGAQPSSQTYYPYGAVRSGTLPTDYTFTGQRADASAGLMYYGARYYDVGLGRFIQPDTIVPDQYNPQALNRYSYVYNNPLRYTDPTGHCPLCVAAIAYAKIVIINAAVDTAIDFGIAQLTGEPFHLGRSLAANVAIDAVTAGVGGKIAKGGKIATLAAKYGDEAVELAQRLGLNKFFGRQIAEEAIEKGLRSFTADNFRENLRRLTGKTVEEIGDLEAHHVLPQKYRDWFWNKLGVNVDDPTFGAWVAKNPAHQRWSRSYEQEWDEFIDSFRAGDKIPTVEETLRFAQKLAERYGFDVLFTAD